jgi:uncharacterized protein
MYFEIYQGPAGGIINAGLQGSEQQWRWRLKSANHEIIASGESYHNKADCLHAIGLIQGTNPSTPINEIGGGLLGALAKKLQEG